VFSLSASPIDPAALGRAMAEPQAGACVTFEGWVRNHQAGRAVARLEYEAFAELAAREGERILAEVRQRFAIYGVWCVHRTGMLQIGDLAVWVGVTAAHRGAAFDACRYVIDEAKARLPIWKKEHYVDGSSEWVNCAVRTGPAEPPAH
jgi:molybdopterin synthase catalytic subunit